MDLARAIAEPALLGEGREAWHSGHDALLASRLLPEAVGLALPPALPVRPTALALARTLAELRRGGVAPGIPGGASRRARTTEDAPRLRSLALLLRRFDEVLDARFADRPWSCGRRPRASAETAWLQGAEVLLVDDLELDAVEKEFLAALARTLPVRILGRERPAGAPPVFLRGLGRRPTGSLPIDLGATIFAPLAPARGSRPASSASAPRSSRRPRAGPSGTAPWSSSRRRARRRRFAPSLRRLLRDAARGVPFEEMGVILPRPEEYASLFTDVLERLRDSLPPPPLAAAPLRPHGALAAAALRLPRPGAERRHGVPHLRAGSLRHDPGRGAEAAAGPQWDALSRDARHRLGAGALDRGASGATPRSSARRPHAKGTRSAQRAPLAPRRRRARPCCVSWRASRRPSTGSRAQATWREWSESVADVLDQWILPVATLRRSRPTAEGRGREVIADLGGLAALDRPGASVAWTEFEVVLQARFE